MKSIAKPIPKDKAGRRHYKAPVCLSEGEFGQLVAAARADKKTRAEIVRIGTMREVRRRLRRAGLMAPSTKALQ